MTILHTKNFCSVSTFVDKYISSLSEEIMNYSHRKYTYKSFTILLYSIYATYKVTIRSLLAVMLLI